MRQSREESFVEAAVNVGVGYALALGVQAAVFPIFDLYPAAGEHLAIAAVFTAVALARNYAIRRLFEGIRGQRTENRAQKGATK